MIIQNKTTPTDCESFRKYKNQELVKIVSSISGLRDCAETKTGIFCKNSTVLKLKSSIRAFNVIKMSARNGDTYKLVDRITFEKGKTSCVKTEILVQKY